MTLLKLRPIEPDPEPLSANGDQAPAKGEACEVREPALQKFPCVFASPHSGAEYSDEFLAASTLDPLRLRSSEDCYVDELFGAAPALGAPPSLRPFSEGLSGSEPQALRARPGDV